jgi:hypothetical protein
MEGPGMMSDQAMPWPPKVLNEKDAQLSAELRGLVLLKPWISLVPLGWQVLESAAGTSQSAAEDAQA